VAQLTVHQFTSVSDQLDQMEVAAARHEVSYAGMCGRGHPVGVQWKVNTGRHRSR
jgi:hypothetical protein